MFSIFFLEDSCGLEMLLYFLSAQALNSLAHLDSENGGEAEC